MCGDACAQDAIYFSTDKEGFWYPSVDDAKCSKCGLCVKKCPVFNAIPANKEQPTVYAAWSKEDKIRYLSTSGGVFFELANAVIAGGGYVVGCCYSDDYYAAQHIVGNDAKALQKMLGSKYLQSDTQGVYKAIRRLLDSGETVLFSGTPCQNAALQSYLNKEYNNLYQCDFICRGINSPLAYKAFISELEREYGSKVAKVRFKSKRTYWGSLATEIDFKNGKKYFKDRYNDPWINGYLSGNLYMRPVCTHCQYKTLPRVSDISFGDFWGIKDANKEDLKKGISVIMINSSKGNTLLKNSMESLCVEKHSIEEAISGNNCILKSTPAGKNRGKFFEMIEQNKFSKAVWKLTGLNAVKRIVNKIKSMLA